MTCKARDVTAIDWTTAFQNVLNIEFIKCKKCLSRERGNSINLVSAAADVINSSERKWSINRGSLANRVAKTSLTALISLSAVRKSTTSKDYLQMHLQT